MYNLTGFTVLCYCVHRAVQPSYLIPEHFIPSKDLHPPAQPLTTRNPLSVSADRPALHVSRQWSHTLCVLLCLPLTERRVLRVRPRGSECQRFSLLQGQVMLLCVEGQVVGLEAPGEALLWPWSWGGWHQVAWWGIDSDPCWGWDSAGALRAAVLKGRLAWTFQTSGWQPCSHWLLRDPG